MDKLKHLVLIISLFCSCLASSQVSIYKTYEDFQNGSSIDYDNLKKLLLYDQQVKLLLSSDGVVKKLGTKDIWGFLYKDVLFKVDHESGGHDLVRVMSKGKLTYYENGWAHIQMIFHKRNSAFFNAKQGYESYVSKDLNSLLIPLSHGANYIDIKRAKKRRKNFLEKYPEYNELIKCAKNSGIERIRRCVTRFEEQDNL